MATLVTRSGKGSPLTHAEVDANFTNLNTDKLELSGGTMTGNLSFGDNDKAIFGAGSDLQIYHDSSTNNSVINESGTGNLTIQGNELRLQTAAGGNYFRGVNGGASSIFYNGSSKLTTTSTGIDVTGTVTADGLTVDGNATIGQASGADRTLSVGSAGAFHFDIDTVGSTGRVYLNATNNSTAGKMYFQTADTDRLFINNNGDISFYEDTGTTPKFFWDASAESLTIGYSQEPGVNGSELNLVGSSTTNNTAQAALAFFDGGTNDLATIRSYRGANFSNADLAFEVTQGGAAPAEAMRIDSSGNLLVGKTATDTSVEGFEYRAGSTNYLYLAKSGGVSAYFDRKTNDGDIVQFRKDGTTVGSIGVEYSTLNIDGSANSAGIHFAASSLTPRDNGNYADAGVDLGTSSYRFRNAYLSGGVYLGGTGAANKLDDYEEGTFTPEVADAASGGNTAAGYANRYGYYRKIGSLCYLNMQMVNINTTGMTAGADLVIRGLPFTQQNVNGANSNGSIRAEQITVDANCYGLTPRISANASSLVISENISGANDDIITVSNLNSGATDIFISIVMQLA